MLLGITFISTSPLTVYYVGQYYINIGCGLCAACDSVKPRMLWSLYFNVDNTSRRDLTSTVDNIIVVAGPDELIDYDHAVSEVTENLNLVSY